LLSVETLQWSVSTFASITILALFGSSSSGIGSLILAQSS
jgi:hypothetical protein